MDNFTTLQGEDVNEFYKNYQDALERQRDLANQQLQQQRSNDFASIMSNANARGMLYSNFPAREKVKYDVSTYQPQLVKTQQSYQTGLDKLRSNALNAWNNIQAIQEKINDLNEIDSIESSGYSGASGNNAGTTGDTGDTGSTGDGTAKYAQNGADFQFTDANGNPISFYEYASNQNMSDIDNIKKALTTMQGAGDVNAKRALAALNNANNQMTSEEKAALEILGIPTSGFSLRQ